MNTTATKASEFKVTWETATANPRYNRAAALMNKGHYRQQAEIITSHASEIFATLEEAEKFAGEINEANQEASFLKISGRKAGNKNFSTIKYFQS